MSLTIDKNTFEQAQTLLSQNKVSEAWQVLGNAGDNYALNAAKITNQGTDSFAKTLVKETWENTVGIDLYNQKFDQVAQLHLANYLNSIKNLNVNLPAENNLFVLPKTEQIERSYGDALNKNDILPKAAIDGILNTAVSDTGLPGWTKWLDLFDGQWGNDSDIEDERISNEPYLDSGYSRFGAVLKISQIGSEALYSDSGFEGDVEIVSNYVKDLYGDSASFLENLFAKEIEEQRLSDPSKSNSYIVNSNDTLANIASIYGVTVDELIAANPQLTSQGRISRDGAYVLIKPGETLNIPDGATLDEDSEYCTYTGENIGALNDEEQSALQDVLGILNPTSLREVSAAILGKVNSSINSITQSVSNSYTTFSNSVTNAIVRVDPLVIDLNGDGLKLNSWQQSGVTFDLNGDGFSESTGWTTASSDDVFLVLDKNSNGNVDSIDELFGNSSSTGFEVLSKFDSNADNVINSNDAQFNLLKLWKDSNANGVVNEGELTSLADNGITEISLKTLNNLYSSSGNLVTETAEVKITDPQTNIVSTRTISEVLFAMNQFNSSISNPDEALGPNFTLDINTLLLPYSRGYGVLNSWQVAMTLNSELLETAQTLANLNPSNFYQINSLFETFLFQWAGVEDFTAAQVYESGSSTKIDHRKVAFLEKATGLDFRVPNDAVISQAQTSWDLFYNTLLTRFLTQGTFKEIFPDASYSFSTDTTSINTTLDEAITNILSLSGSLDKNSFLNYAYYSKTILQLNKDQFTSETNSTFDSKVNTMLSSIINSVAIPNFSFNGIFNIGTDAAETLYGSNNSDIVKGLEGDDFIYAESGNDYIEGNEGSDYLKGGAGDDIYKFNLGDGQDTIEETSGTDKIVFGSGITQTSLAFARIGVDLLISITNSSDKIGIKNFFVAGTNRVETLEFADGSRFDLGNLGVVAYGPEVGAAIYGSNSNDVITGGEGDDAIYSGGGSDVVTGGKGNDYLEGGINGSSWGDNSYIFNIGDGQDVIRDYPGNDRILFGEGISKSDITLIPDVANNKSLRIKVGNNGDQITILFFFEYQNNGSKIETLQFSDGSFINLANGLTLQGYNLAGEVLTGTDYNDVISGNSGNDVISSGYGDDAINGGGGNDQIYSGNGNDVVAGGKGNDYLEAGFGLGDNSYIFNLGDGQDEIRDYLGSDRIIFGAGISSSDITLIPSMANSESLIIKIGNVGDQITIISFFQFQHNVSKIETLQFADGSIINLANGLTLQGYNLNGEKLTGTDYDDVITGNIGNDEIRGGNGNDILKGGDGNDIIYANGGDDIITGGKGNDYSENYQETGNDTYIFNLGDGQDTIFDDFGTDKIIFGAGVEQNSRVFAKIVNDLLVSIGSGSDKTETKNLYADLHAESKLKLHEYCNDNEKNETQGRNISLL